MTTVKEMFEMFEDEYLYFDRVENKLSNRPDLHAFIMLDRIVPGKYDIVFASGHDEIYLDVSVGDLDAAGITDNQVRDLVRCGVRLDKYKEYLCMTV